MANIKDAYYFSHDCNARNDEKILMLRAEHGWEGYGLFWALVEMMFESSETNLSHSKIKGIATGLNVTSEKLNEVIGYCIEEGLFQSDGNVFWSNSLCKRKEKFREISAIRAEAGQRGGQVRAERLKRAQEKGAHTKEEWEEMIHFFDYKCVSCNCEIQGDAPVKDHIKPIYKGGSDAITNIQPLCKSCNSGKSQDETDYRLNYCQANAKQMPSKWLANSSKGKESKKKVKESKRNESTPPNPPEKINYAEYVKMTEEQYNKLVEKYGQEITAELIYILDNYKGSKGKTYKDDYRAILSWVVKRYEEDQQKNPNRQTEPKAWNNLRTWLERKEAQENECQGVQ